MFKSTQPLQIRLTEPVIFLRGPSTGVDFRGRPQAVRSDGQPAMVRGLLTLRLSKPTRIRKIEVQLEGKSRTEWPEGIGPRRTETAEEQTIMRHTTTFFSATHSRSRSSRRAQSLGPGVSLAQYDLDDEDVDGDVDMAGVPGADDDFDNWEREGRGRDRTLRSASAMPGLRADGYARRSSFGGGDPAALGGRLGELSLRERGPSPAYTPTASPQHALAGLPQPSRPSSLRESMTATTLPPRDHVLSPIASAAASRTGSAHTDSAGAGSRQRSASAMGRWVPTTPMGEPDEDAVVLDDDEAARDHAAEHTHPSLVRFHSPAHDDDDQETQMGDDRRLTASPDADTPPNGLSPAQRAASLRTIASSVSSSSVSLPSSQDHSAGEYHPSSAAAQAIPSTATSAANTAQASPAPSEHSGNARDSAVRLDPEYSVATSSRSSLRAQDARPPPTVPSPTGPSPRSSSNNLAETARAQATGRRSSTAAGAAANHITETIAGQTSRNGSSSTIVINHSIGPPMEGGSRRTSAASRLTGSRVASGSSQSHRPSIDGTHDDRGRKHGRFSSLSAALRGLSQDVKDRVGHRAASKSRTRADSGLAGSGRSSRTPSFIDHAGPPAPSVPGPSGLGPDGAHPPSAATMLMARSGSGVVGGPRRGSRGSGTMEPFIAPGGGRGGAGRRSRSRERTVSPAGREGDRSESRGRGRNKAMKALSGAFGKGDHDDVGEDEHNWKEFRKGTYNWPISFPIPVTAPPSIHAEFGTVVYRLKATVVRVGALTPNLVEDMEVMMIACPQEDDLEETDNVIVERQWEEQMRYQIALSGKAFPIGGTIVRIMPLLKCKVHRLTVAIEEKTDYFALGRKVARHETPRRFTLIAVKQPDKKERIEPLLPIISDSPTAARDSPLAELARNAALNNPRELAEFSANVEHPEDDVYATLLEPLGPWHLEKDLAVPDCAGRIKFSTKHEKTNISVGHWLKVTIRVERGDDEALDAKGKRKQFDIIIETPIKILDCRVNPQYNSLPSYAPSNPLAGAVPGSNYCSVHSKGAAVLARPTGVSGGAAPALPAPSRNVGLPPFVASSSSSRDAAHAGPSSHSSGAHGADAEDTLLERNIVYDRLMSGQETETGEEPPSYGEAVRNARNSARSASRSVSRVRGEDERADSRERGSRSRSRAGRLRD